MVLLVLILSRYMLEILNFKAHDFIGDQRSITSEVNVPEEEVLYDFISPRQDNVLTHANFSGNH